MRFAHEARESIISDLLLCLVDFKTALVKISYSIDITLELLQSSYAWKTPLVLFLNISSLTLWKRISSEHWAIIHWFSEENHTSAFTDQQPPSLRSGYYDKTLFKQANRPLQSLYDSLSLLHSDYYHIISRAVCTSVCELNFSLQFWVVKNIAIKLNLQIQLRLQVNSVLSKASSYAYPPIHILDRTTIYARPHAILPRVFIVLSLITRLCLDLCNRPS